MKCVRDVLRRAVVWLVWILALLPATALAEDSLTLANTSLTTQFVVHAKHSHGLAWKCFSTAGLEGDCLALETSNTGVGGTFIFGPDGHNYVGFGGGFVCSVDAARYNHRGTIARLSDSLSGFAVRMTGRRTVLSGKLSLVGAFSTEIYPGSSEITLNSIRSPKHPEVNLADLIPPNSLSISTDKVRSELVLHVEFPGSLVTPVVGLGFYRESRPSISLQMTDDLRGLIDVVSPGLHKSLASVQPKVAGGYVMGQLMFGLKKCLGANCLSGHINLAMGKVNMERWAVEVGVSLERRIFLADHE